MKQISLNFGAIKDTILKYSGKEFINESGEKSTILNKFLERVKKDPIQKIQYLIFKNLEEGYFTKERLAERYINQNLNLLKDISFDKIMESNKTIRVDLLKTSHVEGSPNKEGLYENIHTLIESVTRKGFNDIDKSESAYEAILENLLKEKKQTNPDVVPSENLEENDGPKIFSWDFVTKLAVNNFNKRYAHLDESDKSLLKVLLSTEENKKNHLSDLKNENIKTINELILEEGLDNETKESLLNFKSKLENIEKENLDESLINCTELKESLEELKK